MNKRIEDLTDEEILNMERPPEGDVSSFGSEEEEDIQKEDQPTEQNQEEETGDEVEDEDEQTETDDESSDDLDDEDDSDESIDNDDDEQSGDNSNSAESSDDDGEEPKAQKDAFKDEGEKNGPKSKKKAEDSRDDGEKDGELKSKGVDHEAFFKAVTAPFTANGKQVQMRTPEEIVQLMQMGANYTQKMQALKPNLKMMRMLENHNLLDEGKLSYLIDLSKKDPEAIKKLVKESGIDPMDIDVNEDPKYVQGNYQVSDRQMEFDNILNEMSMTENGQETLVLISKTWDEESKNAIYSDPNILRVMSEQKKNGYYDQIVSEVDHQRMLGHLTGMPFLQAYYQVGTAMEKQGVLKPPASSPAPQNHMIQEEQPASRVVDRRPAPPKPSSKDVSNRIKATAPTRTKRKLDRKKTSILWLCLTMISKKWFK